nr:bifunctional nitrilase/nitrile hydratase NIT4B-like [Quercus suber]
MRLNTLYMAMIEAIKEAIWTPAQEMAAVLCNNWRVEKLLFVSGIEVDFGPTAKAKEIWQASMSHVNLEGGCFVLTANQFCKREDNLLSLVKAHHTTELCLSSLWL